MQHSPLILSWLDCFGFALVLPHLIRNGEMTQASYLPWHYGGPCRKHYALLAALQPRRRMEHASRANEDIL